VAAFTPAPESEWVSNIFIPRDDEGSHNIHTGNLNLAEGGKPNPHTPVEETCLFLGNLTMLYQLQNDIRD
jgi:hypothetical protein